MPKLSLRLLFRLFPRTLALSSFICAVCAVAFPQTVRSKAEERFSAFGWTERAEREGASASGEGSGRSRTVRRFELLAADSEDSAFLEQDTGAFPAAPLAALMAGKPVPPLLPGAGSLDFSAAPQELIELFNSIALSLKSRDFSSVKAASTSPFIPVMLRHMTRRLPPIADAAFAGVEIAADGRSARATFRMRLADNADGESRAFEPVFASAEAVLEEGEWKAVDVIFDGDSYEKAVKQAGK